MERQKEPINGGTAQSRERLDIVNILTITSPQIDIYILDDSNQNPNQDF